MTIESGSKLGPYEILSRIGAGGMGEVWRARDPRLNRDVAIKTTTKEFNVRFTHEARAVAALNHSNICHLYDVGPDYLVMELIEGRPPRGPLPLDHALRIAEQIAAAIDAAHEKGIVHRDLKPGNILIGRDGLVKVLDFGLAQLPDPGAIDPETSTTVTAPTEIGSIVGTPSYMAPEQARGLPADKRADIWSFGVILYELVTGIQPFHETTRTGTLLAVLTKDPDISKAPYPIRRLLRSCLEKDPKQRLRDIGDWRKLLDSDEPSASAPAPRRLRVALVIAALGALASAAL
ncbi:MAG: serine/threonine protein kinase, partial [Acidobacteriota bacterium]|nr:serine/threonine protein kinase [Acidobacteriota bacterium]